MKVYSLLVPQNNLPLFYNKNGIWRHISTSEDVVKPNHFWNAETKQLERESYNRKYYDRKNAEWLCFCHPQDVNEYVNLIKEINFSDLINSCILDPNIDKDHSEYNVFICHTDLNVDPVYIGFAAMKGDGEKLW